MKKIYAKPRLEVMHTHLMSMMATSLMERGEGSGGNVAEVKEMFSSARTTVIEWDGWE